MKIFPFILLLFISLNSISQTTPSLSGSRWFNTDHEYNLPDQKGKVILLDFWGVWCSPCIKAIPKLKALDQEFSDENLQIITIHTPKRSEDLVSYIKEHNYPFVTMVDAIPGEDKEVGYYGVTTQRFNVKAFPSYILINREGEIVGGIRAELPGAEEIKKLLF